MNDDFLRQLQQAASGDERNWLITKRLLDSLPNELSQMAWAASIPHWFDAEILAALRLELTTQAQELYTQLQTLPFVEPFEGHGHNIHELTRRLMLAHLWQERQADFVAFSQRAADYFSEIRRQSTELLRTRWAELARDEPDQKLLAERLGVWIEQERDSLKGLDTKIQIECVYHLLIANPEEGADALRDQGWQWHDSPVSAYALVGALAQAAREHTDAGHMNSRGRGWTRFWEGLTAYHYYKNLEAITAFHDVIAGKYADDKLNADARFRLGNAQLRLSELTEARQCYEQALPIYRTIGEKLGEANCIWSLGDAHLHLSELPEARQCYEQALAIFRAINNKLGEANCISRLGDAHLHLSELPEARQCYEQALPIFRAISNKLGEANCIARLGDVHLHLSELPEARQCYEQALPIFRAISDKLGEANCINGLGDVHLHLSELPEARQCYKQALPIFRAISNKLGEANCIKGLGNLAVEEKDFTSAFKLYEEALVVSRTISLAEEASVLSAIANAYDQQKEYARAIEAYTHALELCPDHAYLWLNRAYQYLKFKDTTGALHDIEMAAHLQSDNDYLFLRRGELETLHSNWDEAIAHFQAALELHPRMNHAYFGIGLAHLRAGRPVEASTAYQKGLSVTNVRKELDDAVEELEQLKVEQPELAGVEEALEMMRGWRASSG